MTVVQLQFPAGRFHGTPWGRHVNKGAVEWPPSPWRLFRALVATWHLKNKVGSGDDTALRAVLTKLASALPAFQLPGASAGHTRHYMPINEGKNEKRTKVFDTFLHPAGPLKIAWEVDLDENERALLAALLKNLSYFGRAESLVEATLLPDGNSIEANAQPLEATAVVAKDQELVRLLTAMSADVYAKWRDERIAASGTITTSVKKRASKTSNGGSLPTDVFEALFADTGDLQRAGWNLPPGSQLISYTRPRYIFDVEPIRRASPARKTSPSVARYAIASTVLPQITQAISVAERVHQSLVKFSDNAPVFSGRDTDGSLATGHRHAHIFCESSGEHRDAITHVTVYAPMGFDAEARTALKRLHSVWGHGGHDLQLVLLGIGDCGDFADTTSGCLHFSASATWRSLTPFVPTRHPKNHRDGRPKIDAEGWHIGSPEHDLRRLIRERGDIPLPQKIERRPVIQVSGRSLRCIQFQRERKHGNGSRGDKLGYSLRLFFPQPVTGPLAFGYGAHFGLGLFVPEQS
ncbi:MAG TPA: type I-U CRISPR-associated protein Csb2 [Candidatus Bathyarchaeia archaeon]|nr:type I-U CRISPR-associated protein Csb2 [Candidatus Bathyarchaeia archaeon]